MSNPPRPPPAWFLRPRVFFPFLVLLVIVSVLLTPHQEGGEARLTIRSPGPMGASGLADLAARLGWDVSELETPLAHAPRDSGVIYAILVRARALSVLETHTLLERVRAGASAIVILGDGAIRDSLHLDAGGRLGGLVRGGDSTSCPEVPRSIRQLATRGPLMANAIDAVGPIPGDTTHLALVRRPGSGRGVRGVPAVLGVQLGRGRLAAIADPSLLSNDVVRVCHWGAGVAVVRTLEWVSRRDNGTARSRIGFDEYHHGAGTHPSVIRAVSGWLANTPSGRVALQILAGGVLLLLALGPRPIAPVQATRAARRSPLEHVGALASAYERVHATRTAARLLTKGVRRRAGRPTGTRATSEEDYLALVAHRLPHLNAEISLVQRGLAQQVSPQELLDITNAVDRIERSLK
jgi:hypothetical protein